jgi:hypothetical protein
MTTPETRPLRLGWGIFAMLAAMLVVIFSVVTFLGRERSMRLPMGFACLSILGFAAFRWHSLRKLVFSGTVPPSDIRRDLRSYFIGPLLPRIIWLVLTVIGVAVLVILQASTLS